MERIKRLMGIRKNEGRITAVAIGYAALIGLAQILLKTIPIILFLTHYKSATLPYIYIISSLLLMGIGVSYSLVERNHSINNLALRLMIFLGISFLVFGIVNLFLDNRWLYLILLVWAQASFDIFDLQLWAVFNRLFTLEQSKRLFGIIGMYQSLAGIAGSLATPLLLLTIGANNSIFVVGLITVAAALILKTIIRSYSERFDLKIDTNKTKTEVPADTKKFNWRDSYLINNMIFAAASLAIYTIIDFMFYTEGRKLFTDEISFGTFLGVFFAGLNIFDLINRGIVSTLLIKYLGVRAGLLIRSISVGLVALLLVILLPLNHEQHFVFTMCVLMKMFDEGFSNSVLRQSVLILYQPLAPKVRTSLQGKIELLIIPLATILASVTLLVFQYYTGFNPFYLAVLLLVIIGLILIVTYFLQKGYVAKLKEALVKRRVSRQQYLDKNYAKLLAEKIKTGTPSEVIYCLGLIRKIDDKMFADSLRFCLQSKDYSILYTALYHLNSFRKPQLLPQIERIIQDSSDPELKLLGFRAMLFQADEEEEEIVREFLTNSDTVLSDEAATAALNNKIDNELYSQANNLLTKMVQSSDSEIRIRAASIISQLHPQKSYLAWLHQLLEDDDSNVRKAAILASSNFLDKKLYDKIFPFLDQPEFRQATISALIKADNKAIPLLTDSINYCLLFKDETKIGQLIKIIGFIKGVPARRRLLQLLKKTENRDLKLIILESLKNRNFKAKLKPDIAITDDFIEEEEKRLIFFRNLRQRIGSNAELKLLASMIDKQINTIKNNIFTLFEFLYPTTTIQKINYFLDHPDIDKASYAQELFEHTVASRHKKLATLICKIYLKDFSATPNQEEVIEIIRDLLKLETHEVTGLVKSAAIYLSVQLKLNKVIDDIHISINDSDKIVHETARWASEILQHTP